MLPFCHSNILPKVEFHGKAVESLWQKKVPDFSDTIYLIIG